MSETRRLGRGLEALLGPVSRQDAEAQGALQELPVTAIRPNPYQPRVKLNEPRFQELVDSMATAGLLQPVVVRRHLDGYQLIAGERRWRAAQKLGWAKIPAVIKEADDRTLLTLALVENLQRQREEGAVVRLLDYRRDLRPPQLLGGPPPAFTRDELISVEMTAYHDRLEQSRRGHRVDQLLKPRLVQLDPGLIGIGSDR